MNVQRSTLVCAAAFAASVSATYAGPCSTEIGQVQDVINSRIHEKASTVTAPAGTGMTQRQPTPKSMAAAEVELGLTSPELFNAVKTAMARAIEADAAGNQSACEQALADAKRLLDSTRTQSDQPRR